MRDAKYFIAYTAPIAAFIGLYFGGWWSPGSFYIGFVALPLLEQFIHRSTGNFSEEEEAIKDKSSFFDAVLYLNVPMLFGLVFYFLWSVNAGRFSTIELIFQILNMGVIVGSLGINIAHELGHRHSKVDQIISKLLYLPALYMHFFIQHNFGHHKKVATPEDPATARKGEIVYFFWFRSIFETYVDAWNIENARLKRKGVAALSIQNEIIWFQLIQIAYLVTIGLLFSWFTAFCAVAIALGGVLLLETINYIEHYGLLRKKLPSGRYEPVNMTHSWNSNHELGRIFLYELTRHSDHHYQSTRKYQVLRHFDESPQLPYGYPTSILLALIPPVWFSLMNERVPSMDGGQLAF